MRDINLISKEIVKAVSDHMHSTLLPALLRGEKVKNEDLEDGWHASIVEILGKQRALIETLVKALEESAQRNVYDGDYFHDIGLSDRMRASWNAEKQARAALAAAKEQSA